jgi:large subunit ribosomal protein L6
MSRVGKNPVFIPADVSCSVSNSFFTAKGKLGQLDMPIVSDVRVEVSEVGYY